MVKSKPIETNPRRVLTTNGLCPTFCWCWFVVWKMLIWCEKHTALGWLDWQNWILPQLSDRLNHSNNTALGWLDWQNWIFPQLSDRLNHSNNPCRNPIRPKQTAGWLLVLICSEWKILIVWSERKVRLASGPDEQADASLDNLLFWMLMLKVTAERLSLFKLHVLPVHSGCNPDYTRATTYALESGEGKKLWPARGKLRARVRRVNPRWQNGIRWQIDWQLNAVISRAKGFRYPGRTESLSTGIILTPPTTSHVWCSFH
jgi:hypothetical protein